MNARLLWIPCLLTLGCADASAHEDDATETELDSTEPALLDEAAQSFELVSGSCTNGVVAARVNRSDSATCRPHVVPAAGADHATSDSVAALGELSNLELMRVERGANNTITPVGQVFHPATSLFAPLEQAVSGQRFFQVRASDCTDKASFSAFPLNDVGVFGFNIQRARGFGDIRVSYARPFPPELTEQRVRHEVLYEQATFRGMVERPTFDILHPYAERPLLITVFDLLPVERDQDRCAP
jgi:hypothetical protein